MEGSTAIKFVELLSASAARNLELAHTLCAQGKKVGLYGSSCCDISQDPLHRHRAGGFFPSHQKSALLVNLTGGVLEKDHLFTAGELSFKEGS